MRSSITHDGVLGSRRSRQYSWYRYFSPFGRLNDPYLQQSLSHGWLTKTFQADLGVARVPSAQHWRFACRQVARGFAAPAVVPSVTLAPPAGLPTLPKRADTVVRQTNEEKDDKEFVVMFVPCESQGLP